MRSYNMGKAGRISPSITERNNRMQWKYQSHDFCRLSAITGKRAAAKKNINKNYQNKGAQIYLISYQPT